MSKLTLASLLAVTAAVSLAACAKEQPDFVADPPTAESPSGMPSDATSAAPEGMGSMPHPTPAEPEVMVDLSGIERAPGGKTIAEVFAEKDQLANQEIVFRGKIVKTNAGVMGKNWLHVRDGSGAEGTNNLTVTTPVVLPNVGDTVLVTGVLELNKDFGMGYQYDLIIEDAQVVVE